MKLLIADDHTLFRDALAQYIQRAETKTEIILAKDFHEAHEVMKKDSEFDLVLLDLKMPGMNGVQSLEKVIEEFPDTKIGLMSGVAEAADVDAAMKLGAVGYFPKTLSGKELIKAIQGVVRGQPFVPVDQNNKMMPSYYSDNKHSNFRYGQSQDPKNQDINLTPREKEVLDFLSRGASNKEIANELGLQVVTVKLHVRGLCRKLDANNRTQAAMKAVQLGLISDAQGM